MTKREPPPSPDPPPAPASKTDADRRPRKWRRRLKRTILVLLALVVVLRVSLIFIIPIVLRKAADAYDLTCTYDRLDMSLLATDVGLWRLALTPKRGGAAVVQVGYIRGYISPFALLRGRLHVRRAEADGVDLVVDRDANGRIAWLAPFLRGASGPRPEEGERPLQLSSPLRVDAFRLANIHSRFRDQSVTPALDSLLRLNVSVSDLGDPVRPARFEAELLADPVLDYARVEGEARMAAMALEADWRVLVRGFHPGPLAEYLRALGIEPRARDIGAHMSGRVQLRVLTPPAAPDGAEVPVALAGKLTISDVTVVADGQEALGLKGLAVDLDRLTKTAVRLAGLTIDGATCRAERSADGRLRVAGLELVGAPPAAGPAVAVPASAPGPARAPMAWRVKELALRECRAEFHDESVTPAADLALVLDEIAMHNLGVDPALPGAAVDLTVSGQAPDVARTLKISASAKPSATPAVLDAQISAEGIEPEALRPYLKRLGLESQLQDATLACSLHAAWRKRDDGRLAADVAVEDIDFRDGAELFSSGGARVTGAEYDPHSGAVRVQAIDVRGPRLSVRREPSGALALLGLRTVAAARGAAPVPAKRPAQAQGAAAASPPPIAVGRFTWQGVNVRWEDDTLQPAVALEIADAGLELTDLDWDPARPDAEAKPAGFHAWLAVPGLLGGLDARGALAPGTDRIMADMTLTGHGVSGEAIAPYLKPAGFELLWQDGDLRLHGRATAARTGPAWGLSVDVEDAGLSDNGEELVGLDRLSVKDLVQGPGRVGIDGLELVRPRLRAGRDADGTLVVCGVRLLPRVPHAAPEPAAPTAVIALGHLGVEEAGLSWTDRALTPSLATSATATVELDGLTLGAPAPPAKLNLTLTVPGSIDELTASGTVAAAPDAPAIDLAIAGKGLRAGPLSAYVPPGARVTMRDGSAHAAFSVEMKPNPRGGRSADVRLTDLLLSDASGTDVPLFKLDAARLAMSRWDPEAGVLAVDEASAGGLEMEVERTADGSLSLLGLTLEPIAAGASAPDASAEASAPAPVPAGEAAPPEAPGQVQARGPLKVPLVTLEKLDLHVNRLSFRDRGGPASAPLSLADLHLRNTERIECLGPDAAGRPPMKLRLTGRIDPLVESLKVDVAAAPFAGEPSLQVDFLASGIQGQGLAALVPELKPRLDGSALTAGELALSAELAGNWSRRTPWDFNLARGANLRFLIKDVAYRASPGGPVLLGLDEMRGEGIQVLPGGRGVRVRSLELASPRAYVWRDESGLHVLGCTLSTPAETAAGTASEGQAPMPAAPQKAPAAQPPAGQPRPQFGIDSFTVAGVDVRLEDRSFTPQLTVPLTGLDVELRDLTTRALTEDRPLRFSVLANSGKVSLPRRSSGGGVAGLVGGAFGLLTGTKSDASANETEERTLFAQFTGSGKIGLYPAPNGWAKFALNGLELAAFSSAAKAHGMTLDRGVVDFSTDIRFGNGGNLDVLTRAVLNDLRMSEPPNGPISRYLSLPAPLDAVIGLLQDADGSVTLALDVPVEGSQVSTGAVRLGLVSALSRVVATAVASAPLKAVGGVGSLVGFTGGGKAPKQEQIAFDFAPGATAPAAADVARLQALARRVHDDERVEVSIRHELGVQDIPIARSRANPSREECLALAHKLQQRRTDLTAIRRQLADEGQAQLASAAPQQSATLEHLRRVDTELARTDDALDRLYDLSRPGSDRLADRRTRAAALDIGQERLEAVQRQLAGAEAEKVAERLHVVRATLNASEENTGGRVTVTLIEPRKGSGIFPLNLLSGLLSALLGLVS